MLQLQDVMERAKLKRQKSDQWLPGAGDRGKGLTTKEHSGVFCGDRNVLYID